MRFNLLFLGLVPSLASAWSLTWYEVDGCSSPLGHIDSGSSSLTGGNFDSNVKGVIAQDSGNSVTVSGGGNGGLIISDGKCATVFQEGGQVTWKYNGP